MSELTANRFQGEIVTVNPEGFAFIGIGTVARENSLPHDLPTESDIFLHKEDAGLTLQVGKRVSFTVVADKRRDGCFRAMGAVEVVEAEVLPALGPVVPGFLSQPSSETHLAILNKLPIAGGLMKSVPEETVSKVEDNQPLPGLPRSNAAPSEEEVNIFLSNVLFNLFGRLASYNATFRMGEEETPLLRALEDAKADMAEMGMTEQIQETEKEVKRYLDVKKLLSALQEADLIRASSVVPIRFLPDLFMAAPVFFFTVGDEQEKAEVEGDWNSADPLPHRLVYEFCGHFPNERWADVFQMFNRRVRTLSRYKGDIIPPRITKLIRSCRELVDTVVIATPYHDIAGKDWEDLEWLRSIDPYVLGFKKGFPFFFVLGRYSDSGVFPLYHEMVADTIEFLRANKAKLAGFDKVTNPYWFRPSAPEGSIPQLGSVLRQRVDELLSVFEDGRLFSWLRGEDVKKEGVIQRQ